MHACTVACKAEYKVPLGENRSWVEEIEKGNYPDVSRSFLLRLRNHCDEPACVLVCPTGATWKREDDGIVVIDKNICIGCKYCVQACPYDMRFVNEDTGTADKCGFSICFWWRTCRRCRSAPGFWSPSSSPVRSMPTAICGSCRCRWAPG